MLNRVNSNSKGDIPTLTKLSGSQIKNQCRHSVRFAAAMILALTTSVHPLISTSVSANDGIRNYVKITSQNAHISKFVKLGLDKSIVVDLPADANDVLVANPKVADAVMRTSRRLYLFGKEVGQTNVFVFDGSGKQMAALEIKIERDITGLEQSLSRLIKHSNIRAEMINDNIVLTGTVQSPVDATRAIALAEIFVKGGEATANPEDALAVLYGNTRESSVVNLLKIEGEDQVLLKVVIAEIQRDVTKQLGISSAFAKDSSDGFSFTALGRGTLQQTVAAGGSGITAGITQGANAFAANLKAMEIAGVIRTLAEPSLTAVSGEEANFRVGGNWQIPQSASKNDQGDVEVDYKETPYGVTLAFTPVVLSEGRISLKLKTEVSEPSSTGSSTQGGVPLYGSRTRIASTSVELPSGGSMAIAGLVQDDIKQVISGMPGLARIPVFGSLFRSREFRRNETELVIIITPYLVRPVARQKLAQPDENFQPASESAGMFMGRVNRVYGTKQGDLPAGRYTGFSGFIYE